MSRQKEHGPRLNQVGIIRVHVRGNVLPIMRCGDCKETRNKCNKSGCKGKHESGWRVIK